MNGNLVRTVTDHTLTRRFTDRVFEKELQPFNENDLMNEDEIKVRLNGLIKEINTDKLPKAGELAFHQQRVATGNMSIYLTHGTGRIYVQPKSVGCDICLSGKVIEGEMYPFMRKLFGKECDGFKQRNKNLGKTAVPFWRTEDFRKLEEAIHFYAHNFSSR
jgi:hypothetical protein